MKYKKIIFVTGGAGFIGSNYLNKYVSVYPDYLFVNLDALTYAGDLKNIIVSDRPNYLFEKIDISRKNDLERVFKKHNPTHIIHFAAETHVDFSIKTPEIFITTNILGTHNLLALSKEYGIKRFHHISTDEVYGSLGRNDMPFTETSLLAPSNPYSASKANSDFIVQAYNKTFGLDTVITRSSNNYGPRQDSSKLIPHFITKLLKKERVPLYGTGENIRDWIYVEDNADAIDSVFHKGRLGEIYNIGGGDEIANIDITKLLLKLTGEDEEKIEFVTDRPGHDFRYAMDTSKIKKEMGWKPKTSFKEGLKKTFEFYRSHA